MLLNDNTNICLMIILFIVNQISGLAVSYNQPKFCPNASWNPNAITFLNTTTTRLSSAGIFVNINNTVYIASTNLSQIQVFFKESITPTRIISGGFIKPLFSFFVTVNDDIYVDNGNNNRVDMWTSNATNSIPIMYINDSCYGLFVDINDTIYCSLANLHQVIKKSLNDNSNTSIIAAGIGISGSMSNMLYHPRGIYVYINFDLYVADYSNNRIQLFRSGQSNGITVAGDEAEGTITLYHPTGIVLDADGYLFIVDQGNHRIIGSGSNGFRCLVGCGGTSGSSSNQLRFPHALSFDNYGNIFVTDSANNRIQKFLFEFNSCDSQTTTEINTSIMTTTKILVTKDHIWTNLTSSANDYSYNYYFIYFLFYFNYIIIL